jgi:hypothetical protein
MGAGFHVSCPACHHKWGGVELSFQFGPRSLLESSDIDDLFRSWFCPRCYFRLYIPGTIERNMWRTWYSRILAGVDGQYTFLREVAASIDVQLSHGRFYTPLAVEVELPDCPECGQPFEECRPEVPDKLVCPSCGSREAELSSYDSLGQMLPVHGFA